MTSNEYLDQVVQEQEKVGRELQWHRNKQQAPGLPQQEAQPPGRQLRAPDYRITGWWRWQTVVVSPNAYVVHTRRGQAEPLHIGLGLSFRYNPYTDAFLVIPGAVQTLLINARCICGERQGILVQGYVQWIVEDIRTAYRKLDFSDQEDPMRVVNVQLREQAEAAIKDKVTTMSIDDVLSDKQPIIEELTHRLRAVAEGSREGDRSGGLGLKIVTVQIKEAVVSSTRLWENLQKPFRAERELLVRKAELETQQQIAQQELTNRQAREMAELELTRQLALTQANQERERYDRDQAERVRRHQLEQEAEKQAIAERTGTEKRRREAELELALQQLELEKQQLVQELDAVRRHGELDAARAEQNRLRTLASIERDNLTHQARSSREERDVTVFKLRREAENTLTDQHIHAQLIERLPEIAAALPKPEELRAVSISAGQDGATASLVGFLTGVLQLAQSAFQKPGQNGAAKPDH